MTVQELNPMIRFAGTVSVSTFGRARKACDARLFYICGSTCRLAVGGREYALCEGALLLWKGGTPYRFMADRPFRLVAVNFDFTQAHKEERTPFPMRDLDDDLLLENPTFTDFEVLNAPIVLNDAQEAGPKVTRLRDEFARRRPGGEALCSAWLKELIIEAARSAQFSTPHGVDKLEAVLRYVEKNFGRPLSNEELAAQAGYHAYHLNRIMKNTLGMTLHRYVTNLRVEKAKECLLSTPLSVAEIAEKCGFRTPYYFTNVFKKQCGLAPSAFRAVHRNRV